MPAKSKAQAKFLGIIAAGEVPYKDSHGLSRAKAKEMLRGTKIKQLVKKVKKPKKED